MNIIVYTFVHGTCYGGIAAATNPTVWSSTPQFGGKVGSAGCNHSMSLYPPHISIIFYYTMGNCNACWSREKPAEAQTGSSSIYQHDEWPWTLLVGTMHSWPWPSAIIGDTRSVALMSNGHSWLSRPPFQWRSSKRRNLKISHKFYNLHISQFSTPPFADLRVQSGTVN